MSRMYRKGNSKNWYGWFYDPAGKRITRSLRTTDKRVARRKLQRLERDAFDPARATEDQATERLEDALMRHLREAEARLSKATVQMYRQKSGHLRRVLGNPRLRELARNDVLEFVSTRQAEGASNHTIVKELGTLRQALKLARTSGTFHRDTGAVIPKLSAKYVPKDRFLTRAEFRALRDALPEDRRVWVTVAVFTGARLSELRRLRWEHVDLEARRVRVRGTKTRASDRWVPMSPALAEALGSVPEEERRDRVLSHWKNVRRDLAAACDRLGIPRVSPNDLRRTLASWLKQEGVDSMIVARLLGHTTSRMVEQVYGHLDDAARKAAVAKLPPIDGPDHGEDNVIALPIGRTGS
ncbi:MAG: hypothetical protein CMN29_32040 [Sandaracinus sp.]|nr:hypothetical protein [Sandaracinus sp.]